MVHNDNEGAGHKRYLLIDVAAFPVSSLALATEVKEVETWKVLGCKPPVVGLEGQCSFDLEKAVSANIEIRPSPI